MCIGTPLVHIVFCDHRLQPVQFHAALSRKLVQEDQEAVTQKQGSILRRGIEITGIGVLAQFGRYQVTAPGCFSQSLSPTQQQYSMILHISVYGARYGGNEPFAETGQPVFRAGGADGRS